LLILLYYPPQDDVNAELDSVNSKLETSKALQTRFDAWAGNWLGGKRSKAMKEAAEEIADRNKEDHSKIREVFQHEKFDSLSRGWRRAGLVLCNDPTLTCDDLFDPAVAETLSNSHWVIDFSLSGIDAEGWTYSGKFSHLNKTGAGDPAPKWNSYVRRRKWRFVDRSENFGALNE
jgi:hypothetical protein